MSYTVVFTPEAQEQLLELYRYIAIAASPVRADRYTSAIVTYCEESRPFPNRGNRRDDIREGLRVTNYRKKVVIAFDVDAEQVSVIGIFYGGQDYEPVLHDDTDVVEATWQHLKRANRPICYLGSLLGSTTDFRHQVQTKRAAADNARREQLEATVVKETLMRCAGGVFFDANGERRLVVAESGESMTVHDFREATPRVAAGAWEPAFVGALEAGRIRSATPDDEERFAACRHAQMSQRPPLVAAAMQALPTRELTAHVGAHLAQLKNVLGAARSGLSPC